jgi:hypothetical protein
MFDVVEDQIRYLEPIQNIDGAADAEFREIYEGIAALRSGDGQDQQLLGAPGVYWKRINAMVAPDATDKLSLPILIVQGGRDYQVPDKDFEIWKQRLADHEHATLRRYPALNHLMIAGTGPSRPEEYQQVGHVEFTLVRDLASWIRNGGRID